MVDPAGVPALAISRRQLLAALPGLTLLAVAPVAAQSDSSATPDGGWSFTDDRGVTISLPERPDRIVAQTTAAAALWDYGIRPVGIHGPARLADGSPDFATGNIDLDAVEWLGDYAALDLELLVGLQPDVFVDLALNEATLWYLGPDFIDSVEQIVPTLGISMAKVSVLAAIERFEALAVSLGADLSAANVVEAKATFLEAEAELKAAIAEKPGLTVLVIAPTTDGVYIASPEWMTDLYYFHDLGLDIVTHDTDNFFELLSWEQLNKYQADLILVDARAPQLQPEQLAEMDTWNTLPAVQTGQIGAWYANAPYSHERLVPIMRELTEVIQSSRADVI